MEPKGIAVVTVEANTQNPRDKRRHEFTAGMAPWTSLLAHLESADFWNLAGDPTERGADKLREVAPLLSDGDEEGAGLVLDDSSEDSRAMGAKAAAAPAPAAPAKPASRSTTPRWP